MFFIFKKFCTFLTSFTLTIQNSYVDILLCPPWIYPYQTICQGSGRYHRIWHLGIWGSSRSGKITPWPSHTLPWSRPWKSSEYVFLFCERLPCQSYPSHTWRKEILLSLKLQGQRRIWTKRLSCVLLLLLLESTPLFSYVCAQLSLNNTEIHRFSYLGPCFWRFWCQIKLD